MNAWKLVLALACVAGVAASIVALNVMIELSAPAMFMLTLSMAFGAYVVWDMVLLKDVDTIHEIVHKENVAYAVFMLIPALLVLAASLVK